MFQFLREYTKLPKHILFILGAEFFLQLINSSFLSNLPLYMHAEQYTDGQIADAIKFRYLGVLISALFVGIYIRQKKLIPLFYLACICVPIFAVGILYTVHLHNSLLNHSMQFLWGAAFTCMQIPVLPFILRNSQAEHHTPGISLSYATWSAATILASIIFSTLNYANPGFFSESRLLYGMVGCSFVSILLVSRVKLTEHIPPPKTVQGNSSSTDRKLIIKALIPTLIIAVGAGFTIPFISLFFTTVHHMSNPGFNLTNLVASVLILLAALLVPNIKKSIGYKVAIPTTQSLAVIALILMATTQYYSQLGIAVYIAVGCFLLRQPLMNLAGPMTSEVVMKYVGKRNQEVVSALTAAIWSGSWFFSGLIFGLLRNRGVDYVNIFLITAVLYSVGVLWYSLLVRDYEKRQEAGLLEV
jgi:predicted MFS family arabinose efflux permease